MAWFGYMTTRAGLKKIGFESNFTDVSTHEQSRALKQERCHACQSFDGLWCVWRARSNMVAVNENSRKTGGLRSLSTLHLALYFIARFRHKQNGPATCERVEPNGEKFITVNSSVLWSVFQYTRNEPVTLHFHRLFCFLLSKVDFLWASIENY